MVTVILDANNIYLVCILHSPSPSSRPSLAGRVRDALREAGSAPELEEGWSDLRAEIDRALAELEGAAAEELQLSAVREA